MLPPYPRLVTELTTIKTNQPDNRSASAYVKAVLQLPVSDARYARDEYGTKCNFYVHDVLHVMGYPVPFMRAREYIDNWRSASKYMQRMVIQDAILNAACGCPTIAALRVTPDDKSSHVMVVLPQPATTSPGDLLIANVGASNFYGRTMRWAIAAKDLAQVEFYGAP